jgi:alpha-D-ribose 1-methylphosphonate 5-phosphate C-P lyase
MHSVAENALKHVSLYNSNLFFGDKKEKLYYTYVRVNSKYLVVPHPNKETRNINQEIRIFTNNVGSIYTHLQLRVLTHRFIVDPPC